MRPPPPPLSPYGTLQGTLFQYSTFPSLVAFESCPPTVAAAAAADEAATLPSKKCILIGGLSDGLLPVPYTKQLETACHERGWSLVQPIISSSYLGFGHGSLERDTKEIRYVCLSGGWMISTCIMYCDWLTCHTTFTVMLNPQCIDEIFERTSIG